MSNHVSYLDLSHQLHLGGEFPRFELDREVENHALAVILGRAFEVIDKLKLDSDVTAGKFVDPTGSLFKVNFESGLNSSGGLNPNHPRSVINIKDTDNSKRLMVCLSEVLARGALKIGYVSLQTTEEDKVRSVKLSNVKTGGNEVEFQAWDRMPVAEGSPMLKNEPIVGHRADFAYQLLESISAAEKLTPLSLESKVA